VNLTLSLCAPATGWCKPGPIANVGKEMSHHYTIREAASPIATVVNKR